MEIAGVPGFRGQSPQPPAAEAPPPTMAPEQAREASRTAQAAAGVPGLRSQDPEAKPGVGIGTALKAGASKFPEAVTGAAAGLKHGVYEKLARDPMLPEPMRARARVRVEEARNATIETMRRVIEKTPENMTLAEQYMHDLAFAGVRMAPSLLIGVATRRPNLALAPMAADVYGNEFARRRALGETHEQAAHGASWHAAAEVLTERVPLGIILARGTGFAERVLKGTVAEGAQEALSSALTSAWEKGTLDPDMTLAEFAKGMGYEGLVGAGLGAGAGAVVGSVEEAQRVLQELVRRRSGAAPEQLTLPGFEVTPEDIVRTAEAESERQEAQEELAQPKPPKQLELDLATQFELPLEGGAVTEAELERQREIADRGEFAQLRERQIGEQALTERAFREQLLPLGATPEDVELLWGSLGMTREKREFRKIYHMETAREHIEPWFMGEQDGFVSLSYTTDLGGTYAAYGDQVTSFDLADWLGDTGPGVRLVGNGYVSVSPELGKQIEKTVAAWNAAFSPDQRTLVFITPNMQGQAGSLGEAWSGGLGPRQSAIALNLQKFLETDDPYAPQPTLLDTNIAADFMDTLAHEWGHAIIERLFAEEAPPVREGLLQAYYQYLVDALDRTYEDVISEFLPPQATALRTSPPKILGTTLRDALRDEFGRVRPPDERVWARDYYMSLPEFIAKMTGRYMTKGAGQRFAERASPFFARVIRVLRRWWRRFGKEIHPTLRTFENWMETLAQRDPHWWARQQERAQERALEDQRTLNEGPDGPPLAANVLPPNIQRLLPERFRDDAKRWTRVTNWGWTLLQVLERNMDIPEVAQYVQEMVNAHNVTVSWRERAIRTYKDWRGLGRRRAERVGDFLLEQTLLGRQPTPKELDEMMDRHQIDDDMSTVVDRVEQDFREFILAIRDASLHNARVTIEDADAQAVEIDRINTQFAELLERPYFPLARFGKHAIVVRTMRDRQIEGVERKEGSVSHMFLYETARERDRALRQVQQDHPENRFWSVSTDTITDQAMLWQGLPPVVLDAIKGLPGITEQARDQLDLLAVAWSPSESFRKRMLRRKKTAGYSREAMRAYAQYFFKGSGHLARIRHFGAAERALVRYARFVGGVEGTEKHRYRNIQQWLQNHLEYAQNPTEEWTWLRNMAFHWFLGFSPASAAVNLTQPFMVTGPFLAARFGDKEALAEFTRAYKDLGKTFWEGRGLRSRDERALVQWGIETGFIDESQATELGGFSRAGMLARRAGGTWAQQQLMLAGQISGYLFQGAERVNRRQTMLAAYRLARRHPDNPDVERAANAFPAQVEQLRNQYGMNVREARAALFARWAVWKTQYEYARYNRAGFMRGGFRANIFVFMQYLQNTLWFLANDPGGWRFMGALFALAGAMGLPGAEDMVAVAKAILRVRGEEEYGRKSREAITELAEAISLDPELFLHGMSRYTTGLPKALGWSSWPIPGVDLSGRLSLGRIVPGLEPAAGAVGQPSAEWDYGSHFMRTTTDVVGASFAMPINLVQAMLSNNPDEYKRWERALPNAARQAWQMKESLMGKPERTRTGDPVVPFDPDDNHHNFEAVMRGMGFRPERSSRMWDLRMAQAEAAKYYNGYRTNLLRNLDAAHRDNDRERVAKAWREIDEWNRDVPYSEFSISTKDVRASLKGRVKGRLKAEMGLPRSRREIGLYEEVRRSRGGRPARTERRSERGRFSFEPAK